MVAKTDSESLAPDAASALAVVAEDLHCGPIVAMSLEVVRGTTLALLGRNGAGKSTLLRAIAGLAVPTRGRARALGPIGYAPQDYRTSLFPWLSVEDNVGLFLRGGALTSSEIQQRVRGALEAVQLKPALLERRPLRLSGGEQQLVVLARALAAEPETLLLDEAFSALDVAVRAMARRAVGAYAARSGATVILVSHDLDDVIELADRAVVIGAGPDGIVADLCVREDRGESVRAALTSACEAAG